MSHQCGVDFASNFVVGYATDVEGNLAFWNKYIETSKVLERRSPSGTLTLRDNCCFVYGGDTCDRGCGDLQVLEELVSLKERYPDRVFLIMGNRDINKMRFPAAMLPQVLSLKPKCYWADAVRSNVDVDPEYKYNDRISKMKWVS